MSYMLTAIEILSRYAFAIPLKKKSGEATAEALKTILSEFHTRFKRYPKIMQFDDGTEFSNPNVKSLLQQYEIQFWVSGTKRKASIIERFSRTLKQKMMKYFSANKTDRWVPILPQLLQNYNSQPHRSIQMAPEDVNQENKHQVWQNLFGKAQGPIPKPKYKVGDLVRVLDYTHTRGDRQAWKIFNESPQQRQADIESRRDPKTGKVKRKDTTHLVSTKQKEKFSDEVFNISEVRLGHPIVYKLYSDQVQGEILGVFYEQELSHVLV